MSEGSEVPFLIRQKYQAPEPTPARVSRVEKRFGWTVAARHLLQLLAFGWIATGAFGFLARMLIGLNSPEGLTPSMLLNGVFEVLLVLTMGAALLSVSELGYGLACWLAANGAPENGEESDPV